MHTYAEPFISSPDRLLSLNERRNAENIATIFRNPLPQTAVYANGDNLLSMVKAHERLSLLAQLNLPCNVLLFDPTLYLRNTMIKSVVLGESNLSILGNEFKLLLKRSNFHTIRLVNGKDDEDGATSLDIYDVDEVLYASIQSTLESLAVWRDVMDNPSLSLV